MKLEKHQGLKEELEKMWGVQATAVPNMIRALGSASPSWPQRVPGRTSEISIQNNAVPGTAEILRRSLRQNVCS